jgi:hypothetical protein
LGNITGFKPSLTSGVAPALTQLSTSSLQLNQIPDKLIIQVRNPLQNTAWGQPDAFLCIKGISVNFNNQSGRPARKCYYASNQQVECF